MDAGNVSTGPIVILLPESYSTGCSQCPSAVMFVCVCVCSCPNSTRSVNYSCMSAKLHHSSEVSEV